jgi:ribokinase
MDVVAYAPRLPLPGETLTGSSLSFFQGGKGANQAVASARAGVPTVFVGRLGEDAFGDFLAASLAADGIDLSCLARLPDVSSGTALITVSEKGENHIVIIPGANALLRPSDIQEIHIEMGDVLVTQLETPLETVATALKHARNSGAVSIFNPAPAQKIDFAHLADIIVLNEIELSQMTGETVPSSPEEALATASRLRGSGDQTIVVTLGEKGSCATGPFGELCSPALKVDVVDTTGGGDCFVGSLAARVSMGDPISAALVYANTAAGLSVTQKGAGPSMPDAQSVRATLP